MNINMMDTGLSKDNIYSYLSVDILKDNMTEQIKNLDKSSPINYLEEFDLKYNYLVNLLSDDNVNNEDILKDLEDERFNFYSLNYNLVCEKFGIKYIEFSQLITRTEKVILINAIYEFFILRIIKNLNVLFYNEVNKNKKSIIKENKNLINTKDLYYTLTKKKYDKDFAVLYIGVENYISNYSINTIDEFLESIICDEERDEYTNSIIYDIFVLMNNYSNDITMDISVFNETIKFLINENINQILIELKSALIRNKELEVKK